jgi:hypothetical protein
MESRLKSPDALPVESVVKVGLSFIGRSDPNLFTAKTISTPFTGAQVVSLNSSNVAVTVLSLPASINIFAPDTISSAFEGAYLLSPAKMASKVCLCEVVHCCFTDGDMFANAPTFSLVTVLPINVPVESLSKKTFSRMIQLLCY